MNAEQDETTIDAPRKPQLASTLAPHSGLLINAKVDAILDLAQHALERTRCGARTPRAQTPNICAGSSLRAAGWYCLERSSSTPDSISIVRRVLSFVRHNTTHAPGLASDDR